MPTTTIRFLHLVQDPNYPFMDHLLAHQSTFFQTKMPIAKGTICPDCEGPLQMLVIPAFTFKRPKQNAKALMVANFPSYKTCFTSVHFLRLKTIKLATSVRIHYEKIMSIATYLSIIII